MIATVMIPEERKSVLIGREGSVKERLERETRTRITVDAGVAIEGSNLDVMKARQVVRAIGRGFSPRRAFLLLDEDYQLTIISLEGETPNTVKRLFARVIGTGGKTRRKLEQDTGSLISVYGKTVAIIGRAAGLDAARSAVEQLLRGRSHGYVYKRLDRRKEKKL